MSPNLTRISILLAGVTLAGCSHSSYMRTSFRTQSGSALIEARGDDPAGVAYYESGEIYGVEKVDRIAGTKSGSWLRRRDAIDHPRLPEWRHQLLRCQDLAEDEFTPVDDLTQSMRGLPFRQAREDLLNQWLASSPERAAKLLDRTTSIGVSRDYAATLCELALRDPVSDERAARWMKGFAEENYREAAARLTASRAAGTLTARTALRYVGDFSSSHRRTIFVGAAARLVKDPESAKLIVATADELSSRDETPALEQLLRREGVTIDLPIAVLHELDERPSKSRPKLFATAAASCAHDDRSAKAIVHAINHMSQSYRLNATKQLLADRTTSRQVVIAMIKNARSFYTKDREGLLMTVIRSPHYHPSLDDILLDAAKNLRRRSRARFTKQLGATPKDKPRRY